MCIIQRWCWEIKLLQKHMLMAANEDTALTTQAQLLGL